MSRNEIGLREARQQLGDLVTAAQYGHTTVITRNGRPAAMLVPYTPPESAMASTNDLAHDISLTLGDHIEDFDIEAIAEDIRRDFETSNIDEVPSEEYWKIVNRHDQTA